MIWKIKIYLKFLSNIIKHYNKKTKLRKEFEREEMLELMDLQNEILSQKHFSITEYQGVRIDENLITKVKEEKAKRKEEEEKKDLQTKIFSPKYLNLDIYKDLPLNKETITQMLKDRRKKEDSIVDELFKTD